MKEKSHKEKIPRRSLHCTICGEAFNPGSEYLSFLSSTDEGWKRVDSCLSCAEKAKLQHEGQFWRGLIPLKKEKKLTPDEKALQLLGTVEEPKLLYVLALYLQRRGQLMKRSETYYEVPETGEVVVIEKATLSPEEGREAGERLVQLLEEPSA